MNKSNGPITQYVIGVAFDEAHEKVVCLKKLKGPAFLIGKITFPGGKLEAGETPQFAIAREFKEETTVETIAEDWHYVSTQNFGECVLHILAIKSDKILSAVTAEQEPVEVQDLMVCFDSAMACPNLYVSDFLYLLAICGTHFLNEKRQ